MKKPEPGIFLRRALEEIYWAWPLAGRWHVASRAPFRDQPPYGQRPTSLFRCCRLRVRAAVAAV